MSHEKSVLDTSAVLRSNELAFLSTAVSGFVYPDMWVDPDDDPRDSAGAGVDGELATLQATCVTTG